MGAWVCHENGLIVSKKKHVWLRKDKYSGWIKIIIRKCTPFPKRCYNVLGKTYYNLKTYRMKKEKECVHWKRYHKESYTDDKKTDLLSSSSPTAIENRNVELVAKKQHKYIAHSLCPHPPLTSYLCQNCNNFHSQRSLKPAVIASSSN